MIIEPACRRNKNLEIILASCGPQTNHIDSESKTRRTADTGHGYLFCVNMFPCDGYGELSKSRLICHVNRFVVDMKNVVCAETIYRQHGCEYFFSKFENIKLMIDQIKFKLIIFVLSEYVPMRFNDKRMKFRNYLKFYKELS